MKIRFQLLDDARFVFLRFRNHLFAFGVFLETLQMGEQNPTAHQEHQGDEGDLVHGPP